MFRRFSSLFREQKPSLSLSLSLRKQLRNRNRLPSLSLSLASACAHTLSLSATNLFVYTTVRKITTRIFHCPCIFPKITCPLSMYLSAQWLKHVASYELNFEDGDVTHFSKHTFANCATTSLNTALRFSSSRNCCIRGSICW